MTVVRAHSRHKHPQQNTQLMSPPAPPKAQEIPANSDGVLLAVREILTFISSGGHDNESHSRNADHSAIVRRLR